MQCCKEKRVTNNKILKQKSEMIFLFLQPSYVSVNYNIMSQLNNKGLFVTNNNYTVRYFT